MTLVEIMIVVIVMSLIATGVAFAVIPALSTAREDQTRIDVRRIHNAVATYMIHHQEDCPGSIDELGLSRTTRRTDAWDHDFVIECEAGREPVVISLGADGQEGTEDDICSIEE